MSHVNYQRGETRETAYHYAFKNIKRDRRSRGRKGLIKTYRLAHTKLHSIGPRNWCPCCVGSPWNGWFGKDAQTKRLVKRWVR